MPELTGWAVRSAVGESGFHQPLLFNSHLSEEQLRRVFLHTVGPFNCLYELIHMSGPESRFMLHARILGWL